MLTGISYWSWLKKHGIEDAPHQACSRHAAKALENILARGHRRCSLRGGRAAIAAQ
jgi:hypothetical protein